MKHKATVAMLVVMCTATLGLTQTRAAVEMTRAQIQADRQAIVAAAMDLTDGEGTVFWPMYREYRAEIEKLGDRKWRLLESYADSWTAMSEEAAKALLDEWFSIQSDEVKIKRKWMKKMRKDMSNRRVLRFFQIENALDIMIAAEIAGEIPLAVDP
jgi:hypothetical protein